MLLCELTTCFPNGPGSDLHYQAILPKRYKVEQENASKNIIFLTVIYHRSNEELFCFFWEITAVDRAYLRAFIKGVLSESNFSLKAKEIPYIRREQ